MAATGLLMDSIFEFPTSEASTLMDLDEDEPASKKLKLYVVSVQTRESAN